MSGRMPNKQISFPKYSSKYHSSPTNFTFLCFLFKISPLLNGCYQISSIGSIPAHQVCPIFGTVAEAMKASFDHS